jgi:hypothetical protein
MIIFFKPGILTTADFALRWYSSVESQTLHIIINVEKFQFLPTVILYGDSSVQAKKLHVIWISHGNKATWKSFQQWAMQMLD